MRDLLLVCNKSRKALSSHLPQSSDKAAAPATFVAATTSLSLLGTAADGSRSPE